LAVDARHNLELARLMLAAALTVRKDEQKPDPPDRTPTPKDPPKDPVTPKSKDPSESDKKGDPTPGKEKVRTGTEKGSEAEPKDTGLDRPPGLGSLPTLPDTSTLNPLGADDTRALLERATRRILDDRRRQYRPPGGPGNEPYPNW
jgi:hypothetical protein